ncbi:MAG: RHS repeat-associated core domain-containing protein [Bacteroidales bacterium]|nr:RHS repeat-associated core domain-containing protein [Bacteroidales bacterium]
MELENNRRIYYLYDANGTKLQKTYYEDNRLMETTDYSGMFVYKDQHIDFILTSEGRLKWDDHDEIFYAEYFIKDHLGNVRSVVSSDPEIPSTINGTDYYPFGMEIPVYGDNDNQIKYNSKELQTEADLDWYDYGARFYDPVLARWHSVDPMAEKSRRWSPYTYCMNNPIRFIDPDGMNVDGYQDSQGNYKWFDGETAQLINKDNKLYFHVTDNKEVYNMLEAGTLDNIPELGDPGEVAPVDNTTNLEMWLDSPSENLGERALKVGADIAYSIVNSPYTLLAGESLGGTEAIPQEKMNAFIDVGPAAISFGMTKTKEVVKVTENSLKGFNQFVERSGITFSGKGWQQRASELFKSNKVNQSAIDGLNVGTFGTGVVDKTKEELDK